MPDSRSSEPLPGRRHPDSGGGGRALSLITLLIAVVAIALAGWTLFRSMDSGSSEPSYSDTQRADAKVKICGAMDIVRRGVSLNTNLQPEGGPGDVTGSLAVAANARLALFNGGEYLLARLVPATPKDLSDAVRKFANTLLDIGAAATAGAQNSEPAQAARLKDADSANTTIMELCK
jgi:hypothetical protein